MLVELLAIHHINSAICLYEILVCASFANYSQSKLYLKRYKIVVAVSLLELPFTAFWISVSEFRLSFGQNVRVLWWLLTSNGMLCALVYLLLPLPI